MVQKRAKNTPLRAEQLPTELWICIFTYLEGHDIVRSFASLNSFFNSLLRSPHVPLHIRIKQNEAYQRLPRWTWSHIQPQNVHALSVGHRRARCLTQFLRWRAPYLIRLRTLSVYMTEHDLYRRCKTLGVALQQIPSLTSIRIQYTGVHGHRFNLEPILMGIFAETPTITRCFFDFDWNAYLLKTSSWFLTPKLTSLRITQIPWRKLFCLLSFTPQLRVLRASLSGFDNVARGNFTLFELRKLQLRICNGPFALLEALKEAAPYVERFVLRGTFSPAHHGYFQEARWQQLLHDVDYFDIKVTAWEDINQQKGILPKRISEMQNKKWFHWEENERDLYVRIVFESSSI